MKKVERAPRVVADKKLIFEGLGDYKDLLKTAAEYEERYLHWDELKYRIDDDEKRSIVWTIMKIMRRPKLKEVSIGETTYYYSFLSDFVKSLHIIDARAAGNMGMKDEPISERGMTRYVISSLMEEAISSSQMEGAAVTRVDAKRMLRQNKTPKNKGERMVLNNYLAMENLKKISNTVLTPEIILHMHATITRGTLDAGEEWEGRFRESDDIVVGNLYDESEVYHRPPDSKKIPRLISDLCDFVNRDEKDFIHPLIKGIMLHYLIGYIHPFVDGNGRLARSLFYWYCLRNGYWIMEYASISNIIKNSLKNYSLAYQFSETDEDDLTYFIRFNLNCVKKAIEDLDSYLKRKAEEQKAAYCFIEASSNLNSRRSLILKEFLKRDTPFSVIEIQRTYGISYQTARTDIIALEESGYIRKSHKEGKKVFYVINREKLIDSLN